MVNKISEASEIQIPLKNLLGIILLAIIGSTSYFSILERINNLENDIGNITVTVIANENWISEWQTSGILPLDQIQNLQISLLQEDLKEQKALIDQVLPRRLPTN